MNKRYSDEQIIGLSVHNLPNIPRKSVSICPMCHVATLFSFSNANSHSLNACSYVILISSAINVSISTITS